MIWTAVIGLLIILAVAGTLLARRRLLAPEVGEFEPAPQQVVASIGDEHPHVILHLPSSHPHFQFTCDIEYRYAEIAKPPRGLKPRRGSVEWTFYNAVKDLSSQFPLTRKDQLKYELSGALRTTLELQGGRFVVWGECSGVEVDPVQADTVYAGYREDAENERMRRRIEFLGKVFEDPRIATMWWLSQHTDQIDQLDEKSELLYELDRRLNPDRNPLESTVSQDLRQFIATADESGRSAIGIALHNFYRDHRLDRFAKEALRLIPQGHTVIHDAPESDGTAGRSRLRPVGEVVFGRPPRVGAGAVSFS